MEACATDRSLCCYTENDVSMKVRKVMIKIVNPREGSVKELVLSKFCSPVILIYLESITDA